MTRKKTEPSQFLFPDPDDPTKPYPAGKLQAQMLDVMKKAGIRPEIVYAYKKTGFFPNKAAYEKMSPQDRAEWDAAIDEYFDLEGKNKRS